MRRMTLVLAGLLFAVLALLDSASGQQKASGVLAPAPAPARPRGPGVPAANTDQFQKAVQIAKLAAEHDMHALSLRAVREALRGGPPIQIMPEEGRMYGRYIHYPGGMAMMEGDPSQSAQFVEERLLDLDQVWLRRKFPADQVYETLAQALMPESRPAEIFLYQRPLAWSVQRPRSLGKLLAQWTARAGKQEDLKKRIAARQSQPLAELPARVLLAQLGLASKDSKLTIETLGWFAERLKKDTLQNTAEMACHAALPALLVTETSPAALPVIEMAVKNLSGQNLEEPTGSIRLVLARFHFEKKNDAAARQQLQEFLKDAERFYANYGGDYSLYRRKEQLGRVATEYARAGHTADTLELLGQWADAPRYRGGEPPIGHVVAAVSRQLAVRPAAERYDLLKAFALPTANRKSVRLLAAFKPMDEMPAAFAKLAALPARDGTGAGEGGGGNGAPDLGAPKPDARPGASNILGNVTLLLDAARELGKLDELAKDFKALADQKIENADTFHYLVQIARGEAAGVEPQLKELLEERKKTAEKQVQPTRGGNREPISWPDYLVARACLTDAKLRDIGEGLCRQLLQTTQRNQEHVFMSHLRQDLARSAAARAGGVATAPGQDHGLALWRPAVARSASSLQGSAVQAWWLEHEGHLAQICGPESNWLYFNCPLTGEFEFSADCYSHGWAEGNLSYGGLAFDALHNGAPGTVSPVGGQERLQRPYRCLNREGFNHIVIQARPGKLRVLLNGHLFYETDKPAGTAPWLALYSSRERQTYFRNLALKGKPEIPREIKLIDGDRMEGWATSFYNETRPPRLTAGQAQPDLYDQYGRGVVADATLGVDAYDWAAKEGVLHGRRGGGQYQNPQMDLTQSRIYYHRPLHDANDGETVSYEFLYEPGVHLVHPALGRLAFLLEPDGVKAHWMTSGLDNDWSGLKADNAIIEPNCRRGPERLPLKAGEWNAVRLTVKRGKATLELNGTLIYERELEPAIEPQFGFFHFKDQTAVQVRNVVLRGNWPERLTPEQLANLLQRSDASAAAGEPIARAAVIGEPIFYLNTYRVVEKARQLPAAQRFAFLSDWVLPGPRHKAWRLYGDATPTDPAPPVKPLAALGAGEKGEGGVRAQTGGEFVAPVLDLIAGAKELGKLDELAQTVAKIPTSTDHEMRGKLAMTALIQSAQGREDAAAESLKQLLPMLARLADETPEIERWPEITAAAATCTHPKLHTHALALLDQVVVKQMQKPGTKMPKRPVWERQVRNLRARGQMLATPQPQRSPFGAHPNLAYWSPVTHPKADTRGHGNPIPHWTVQNGEIKHHTGHDRDYFYFNVPLRGNFEINCELTAFGWREAQLNYGGLRVFLVHTLKTYNLEHFNRSLRSVPLEPPVEKVGEWYAYRLAVQDGVYTAHVNGRKIHEERLPADPDPWLALHQLAHLSGGLRNLRITGNPTIPDELNPSGYADLSGWMSEYYGESATGQNAAWEKRGDEIFGRCVVPAVAAPNTPDQKNTKQESLLQYHRPMLEDGEIEYEFFHEPGKTHVHPALDRLTFLLDPEGVKIHWLTDAQHDRTGLVPENVTVEAGNRRGPDRLPLKENGWNHVKLGLTGNKVTLRLNDTAVYERELEPTNLRSFGLFHYADETEVRARNVKYRGQWPKKLPAAEELLTARAAKTRGPAGE